MASIRIHMSYGLVMYLQLCILEYLVATVISEEMTRWRNLILEAMKGYLLVTLLRTWQIDVKILD